MSLTVTSEIMWFSDGNIMCKNSKKLIAKTYELGQRRCPVCCCQLVYNSNQKNTATFEHLVPKSSGGIDSFQNGLVVCRSCNNRRGNRCWLGWIVSEDSPKREYLARKYLESVKYHREVLSKNIKIKSNKKLASSLRKAGLEQLVEIV